MNRILDKLWLGSAADVQDGVPLRALGFQALVDLRDSAPTREIPGVETFRLLNRDGDPWKPEDVSKAMDFIAGHVKQGHRVLVVCVAGMSRSASIVIGYLCHCGFDVPSAFEFVKKARPEIAPIGNMLEAATKMVT